MKDMSVCFGHTQQNDLFKETVIKFLSVYFKLYPGQGINIEGENTIATTDARNGGWDTTTAGHDDPWNDDDGLCSFRNRFSITWQYF